MQDLNININMLFLTFFIAIAFNFLTMSIVTFKYNELQSEAYNDAKFRTIGEFVLLLLLFLIYSIFFNVDIFVKILSLLLLLLILNESALITKNLHKLSVWTPNWSKQGLEFCKKKLNSIDINETMEDKK